MLQEPRGRGRQEASTRSPQEREPEARAGSGYTTARPPTEGSTRGLKPPGVREGLQGSEGRHKEDEEQPRRAARRWQQRANGAKTTSQSKAAETLGRGRRRRGHWLLQLLWEAAAQRRGVPTGLTSQGGDAPTGRRGGTVNSWALGDKV